MSDPLVRANIRVKEGDPFNRYSMDDDVRNLYATGHFLQVRVGLDRAGDDISLIYTLQGS